MVTQVAKWGNSQGVRLSRLMLNNLNLCVGDTVEIKKEGNSIIMTPTHGIDWYLSDYEQPDSVDSWEHFEPVGREVW